MIQPAEFTRTAPVYKNRKIVLSIDSENPLSSQLAMITGDGWNSIDWTDTLRTGEITHKKSGLIVKVISDKKEKSIQEVEKQIKKYSAIANAVADGYNDCEHFRREGAISAAEDYVIDLKKILATLEEN